MYQVNDTNQIGFSTNDPSYIPDEYLDNREFVVFRTAHGIGDWGIISAMPRLLKLKYPDCFGGSVKKGVIENVISFAICNISIDGNTFARGVNINKAGLKWFKKGCATSNSLSSYSPNNAQWITGWICAPVSHVLNFEQK